MKKLTLLALIAASFALQSCLKDRSCVCTHYDTSLNENISVAYKITRSSKSHAEEKCAQLNDPNAQYPTSCSIQ